MLTKMVQKLRRRRQNLNASGIKIDTKDLKLLQQTRNDFNWKLKRTVNLLQK